MSLSVANNFLFHAFCAIFAGMKRIIALFAAAVCMNFVSAQTIDSLFVKAPTDVLPMLDRTARLNMLDYYNSGMDAIAENTLGGRSVLERKDGSMLRIRTTDSSVMEIIWLKSSRLILCLHTLQIPAKQTYLELYDESWQKHGVRVPKLTIKDFLSITDDDYNSEEFQETLKNLSPLHFVMEWSFEKNELVCRLSQERIYKDDLARIKPHIVEKSFKLYEITN